MKFSILLACLLLVGCNHHNIRTELTIKLQHPDQLGDISLTTTID